MLLPRYLVRLAATTLACAFASPIAAADWMITDPGQGSFPIAGSGATELSGLAWTGGDTYVAVSDSGGRLFPITAVVDPATGRLTSASVGAPTTLGGSDLEGIARIDALGEILTSDESGPHIRRYTWPGGVSVGAVAVPGVFANARNNLSLESLAWDPTTERLWTANEEALASDGPVASFVAGTTVRLQRFDAALQADGQWPYTTDALPGDIQQPGRDIEASGVTELIALPDGGLLALERAVGGGAAIRHRLYEVDVTGASDSSGVPALDGAAFTPAAKELVWEGSLLFTNLEGAALGRTLDDGSRSLLLVSDNGGGLNQVLYALRLRPLVCGDGIAGGAEECDDGNTEDGDGCSGGCLLERCGDGLVNGGGERCDDGNLDVGDGCDDECRWERDVRKCQEAVAKAGRVLLESRVKALQSCRNRLLAGKELFRADAPQAPIAGPAECPTEVRAARAIARSQTRAHRFVERKCDDHALTLLSACAATVGGLIDADLESGCLILTHASTADTVVDTQYGDPIASSQRALRRCQETIAKAGWKLTRTELAARQACRNQWNRGRLLYADADRTQVLASPQECSTERRTERKLERAGATLRRAVARRCDDAGIAAIGGLCAESVDDIVAPDGATGCLVAAARTAVDTVLAAQY